MRMTTSDHALFMLEAVDEGEKGRLICAPNPWVGCVIVQEGQIIGRGHHHGPGTPHAEVEAVRDAERNGFDMVGSTLYSTLEPCHAGPGKRTPPCDEMIVRKGILRVVIGVVDTDPVFGCNKGVQHLIDHGIEVFCNIARDACINSLRPYLHHRKFKMPYVILKIATSMDGKISCSDKSSQWITMEGARSDSHLRMRASSQAMLIGSETYLQDRPRLNVRLTEDTLENLKRQEDVCPEQYPLYQNPLRVVLDRRGRLSDEKALTTGDRDWLVFSERNFALKNAEVVNLKSLPGYVPLYDFPDIPDDQKAPSKGNMVKSDKQITEGTTSDKDCDQKQPAASSSHQSDEPKDETLREINARLQAKASEFTDDIKELLRRANEAEKKSGGPVNLFYDDSKAGQDDADAQDDAGDAEESLNPDNAGGASDGEPGSPFAESNTEEHRASAPLFEAPDADANIEGQSAATASPKTTGSKSGPKSSPKADPKPLSPRVDPQTTSPPLDPKPTSAKYSELNNGVERGSLIAILEELGKRGVLQVVVEGGSELQGAFLRCDLVQEICHYQGACLLGNTAQPWATADLTRTISDAVFWKLGCVTQIDNDVVLEYMHSEWANKLVESIEKV